MATEKDTKQSSSGLDFHLHPLVLLNVSDHHTRAQANLQDASQPPPRVLGCLLGQQTGRVVDVSNSFEFVYEATPTGLVINEGLLAKKTEQYKQVFPKLDIVGWYATGEEIQDDDMAIHRKVMELNESPVFLLFHTQQSIVRKDLPVSLYESELHVMEDRPSFHFVQAKFTVETSEAERIGVNQVAKVHATGNPTGTDQLAAHLTAIQSALKMLSGRIGILYQHIQHMQNGQVPHDHALLRQASSLLRSLPAMESKQFKQEYIMEYSDAMLSLMMSTVTKGLYNVNEVVDKFNMAYDRLGRRRTPM
ncbi:hypothetical protein ABBQ32_010296 [Trebouxia sp. C0010 RCD-2024]